VIRFGRIGDMIMLTALLDLLHRRYGKPCQVIGAGVWNEDVYRGHPDVARVWSFPRHAPFALSLTWPRVVWALRRTAPAPIYIAELYPRQLPRVRRLLGSSGVDARRCLFITDEPTHEEDYWWERLRRFGERVPPAERGGSPPATPSDPGFAPRLTVSEVERANCNAWLRERGWSGRQIVLVQPGNARTMSRRNEQWRRLNTDDKAWPVERWAELLRRVHARSPDAILVLRGFGREIPVLDEIQAAAGLPAVAVAEVALRPLFALCERAHSMISVDTGPAHAAAALGLPLVVLYGSESPRRWLPRSPTGSAVIAVGGPPHSTRADQLSAEAVFDAWCAATPC
jgi:heptosyltransferase-2/heptosyltransferase-3